MGNFLNLKSVFTADTKDLKAGAKEAKQAVKDFDDATTAALDEVTALFGTSMKEVSTALSTVRGGLLNFQAAMSKAADGVKGTEKALKMLKVAIISTGIGALLVALGSLVAYFTKSQRGADKLAVVMGQLKQVFLVVTDYAIKFGEVIVNAFTWTIKKAQEAYKWIKLFTGRGWESSAEKEARAIDSVFAKRKQLTLAQQKYEDDRIAFKKREKELELAIEEQREIMADKANRSLEERAAANKKAQELVNQLFQERTALAEEALRLLREDNSMSESMRGDKEAEIDLEIEILNIAQQRASMNKELLAQETEIANQKKAQADAAQKAAAAALSARKKEDLTLKKIDSSAILDRPFKVEEPTIDTSSMKKGLEETEGYMVDFQQIAVDFSNTIADAFSSMIEGLVTGELNMKDIFNTVLSFLADNLKAIGKALMAYGAAMIAFKKAVENPPLAIAAGAALLAAGSVLSGLIKNMSSGGGESVTPSTAYAAATINGGGTLDLTSKTQMQSQRQEIRVTGTIKAAGRDLAIILENEKKRKDYTT